MDTLCIICSISINLKLKRWSLLIKGNKKETDYFEHHQLFNINMAKFPNVNYINDNISYLTVCLWKLNEVIR